MQKKSQNNFNYSKLIDIEDYEDSSLKPILEELAKEDSIRFGLEEVVVIPDSKKWESAMAIKSFKDFNILKPGNTFVGIGAGIEINTFYLASKGCICFPVDKYLSETPWSDVAPIGMMIDPKRYSPIETKEMNIIPVHSDARYLRLPSNYFDGIYSAGSIEHFGSLDKVSESILEIERILKPGGIASITTEFRLDGPVDRPWFDDNVILFTKELIEKYIIKASKLTLIGSIESDVSEKTYETRKELADFLESTKKLTTIEEKQNIYPNFVLHNDGFLFCSIHLLLKKGDRDSAKDYQSNLIPEIEENNSKDISNLIFKTTLNEEVNKLLKERIGTLDKIIKKIKNIIHY